jgi:hypothetical protein
MIVYITRDLMFSSRVRPIATNLGLTLKVASTWEDGYQKWQQGVVDSIAASAAETPPAHVLVVDLKAVSDLAELTHWLPKFREGTSDRPCRTLAYGPHVHEAHLAAAKQAGFDAVMTQGQFDRTFATWLAGPTTSTQS